MKKALIRNKIKWNSYFVYAVVFINVEEFLVKIVLDKIKIICLLSVLKELFLIQKTFQFNLIGHQP
jgi:hypothetical protein